MKLLQIAMDERQKILMSVSGNHQMGIGGNGINTDGNRNATGLNSSGTIGPLPNLGASVKSPWERATTPANVPYYIEYVLLIIYNN